MTLDFDHPVLGPVQYQSHYGGCYSGMLVLDGDSARFDLWETDVNDARRRLDALAVRLPDLSRQIRAAKVHSAVHLLDLKNNTWTEEDGSEVTGDQFVARLRLVHLDIRPQAEGQIDLTFDDGDLFFGHVIQVSMDVDGGLSEAQIAG
jgi:hypothetical protein